MNREEAGQALQVLAEGYGLGDGAAVAAEALMRGELPLKSDVEFSAIQVAALVPILAEGEEKDLALSVSAFLSNVLETEYMVF